MGTISASGDAHPVSAGNTVVSEMNDRSATISVDRAADHRPASARARWSARRRPPADLIAATRPAGRSPTSTATTSAAPRSSRTSVNPPVEAPASRQRRPSTPIPKASSAPMSLCAPRDTQLRSPSSATFSAGSRRNRGAGLDRGHAVDADLAGADQLRGLLAGSSQPAPDQLGINAGTPRHGGLSPSPPTPAPAPACRAPQKAGAPLFEIGFGGLGSSALAGYRAARRAAPSISRANLIRVGTHGAHSTLVGFRPAGPALQGVAGGVVAGLDADGRSVEAGSTTPRWRRRARSTVRRPSSSPAGADRHRASLGVDMPGRLRRDREHVGILVQRPQVAADVGRAAVRARRAPRRARN